MSDDFDLEALLSTEQIEAIEEITSRAQYRISAKSEISEDAIRHQLHNLLGYIPPENIVSKVSLAAQKVYRYNVIASEHCLNPFLILDRFSKYSAAKKLSLIKIQEFSERFAERILKTPFDELPDYVSNISAKLGKMCIDAGCADI